MMFNATFNNISVSHFNYSRPCSEILNTHKWFLAFPEEKGDCIVLELFYKDIEKR